MLSGLVLWSRFTRRGIHFCKVFSCFFLGPVLQQASRHQTVEKGARLCDTSSWVHRVRKKWWYRRWKTRWQFTLSCLHYLRFTEFLPRSDFRRQRVYSTFNSTYCPCWSLINRWSMLHGESAGQPSGSQGEATIPTEPAEVKREGTSSREIWENESLVFLT